NLQHAGYSVRTAPDAHQALEQIQRVLPDLILLDWMLPDQPGIRLARQLRSDTRTRDIPLIMLTARSAEQDKVDGLEAGADDYIQIGRASCRGGWRQRVRGCASRRDG